MQSWSQRSPGRAPPRLPYPNTAAPPGAIEPVLVRGACPAFGNPYNRGDSQTQGRGSTTRIVIFVLAVTNFVVLFGVFVRRLIKNHYYALKDERRLYWGQVADGVLLGEPLPRRVPSLRYPWDWEAAEGALQERILRAAPEARAKLQSLFRQWGLFQRRLQLLLWGNPWQQGHSALALARMDCREALPAVVALLERPYTDIHLAAVNALSILAVPEAVKPLVGLLPVGGGREARAVLAALIRCAQSAPQLLLPYLKHPSPLVRLVAAAALAELARHAELPALLEAATDADAEVRSRVARALGHTGEREAVKGLARLAADPVWFVRLQAVTALGRMGGPRAQELLWKVLEDPDERVRKKAAIALHQLIHDPVQLLARLRKPPGDATARAALVDHLARTGVTRQALNRVQSPVGLTREENQAIVRELLRSGFYHAVLYAVETHPEVPVRHELLRLVEEEAGPGVQPLLAGLLQSPTLDAESRRRIEALRGREGARA